MRVLPPSQRVPRPRHSVRAAPGHSTAAALLGEAHPLVGVLQWIESIRGQLVVVAATHALGLGLWWWQIALGVAVAIGALMAEVVLGCRLFLLTQRRRDMCVDLIAQGREDLPLAAVERERRRLASPRYRARLARTIEELARPLALHPVDARPPLDPRALEPARPQLQELAQTLPRHDVSIRGVALLELLITSPMSPLYGAEPDRLKRELGRVRYLLRS